MLVETPGPDLPGHDVLVAELRLVRRHGPTRLRVLTLPGLSAVARLASREAGDSAGAIERLLRTAAEGLNGNMGAAAGYSFGLAPGTRDWPVGDRRKRAAQVYGVSTERFRKHHEPMILGEFAERLADLCRGGAAADPVPRTLQLSGRFGGVTRPVLLHAMPVELLREVDVIVSPINTHLELPQSYKSSFAATLRRAAALLGPSGEMLDDVVQRELTDWNRRNGRPGLPVAPGTIVPGSPGQLGAAGIRRIYHAAVTVPASGSGGSGGYDVRPHALARAVGNVLRTARDERDSHTPPLRSLCFPLLGAGRGGLAPTRSFAWIAAALDRELRGSDDWTLAFVARSAQAQNSIIEGLALRG